MGVYVVVIEPDGSEREEEIFMEHFPASRAPAGGQGYTPRDRIRAMYATTRHLLGPSFRQHRDAIASTTTGRERRGDVK